MESSTSFLAVALISLLAAISPGPDFFVVFRNSLVYSRKAGFLTAFGIAMALIIHLTYTLIGLGVLIAESPLAYAILKYLGVAYLFYIGLKSFLSSFKASSAIVVDPNKNREVLANYTAFMQGFWTNFLNPKAAIFLISLFSQFIDGDTHYSIGLKYGLIIWFITLAWFLLVSYLVTHQQIVSRIHHFRFYIDRVMGAVLIALGFKIIFT